MEFKAIVDPRGQDRAACAVIGVHDDGALGETARRVDARMGGLAAKLHASRDFAGKVGDTMLLTRPQGSKAARVLLVGLGSKGKFGRKPYRRAVQAAAQAVLKTGATDAVVYLAADADAGIDAYTRARIVAETFCAQNYRIPDLKTGPKPKPARLRSVRVAVPDTRSVQRTRQGLTDGVALGEGVAYSRDLANLPPNVCTPTYLGNRALALGRELRNIKVRVLGERRIKALKMGAFLAVARGSAEPPRLIVCEYRGAARTTAPICLIGKGITFDSGGISLKDPPAMDEMKFDMSGAASVLGALRAVARMRLPVNLVVIVATCENMPAGNAVKPSDVVRSMSGQTVEVLNTDAEGRLILCDAIHYSRRFKPAAVIDVATLTGACIIALGNHFSGLMSNDDSLAGKIAAAGLRADDRAWRLPIGEEYVEQLKSNFADLANIGGREGGASTAAAFLSKFAAGLHWAHLDVAGTAWLGGAQKGSTGRPVPLLVDFLIDRAREK
ncbi:MAG TPA: leucyl aminopeptidase [Steroidobacteraceae bacterium]|nr:leucyl aminopeptidase [Steroidobacteraceae bacterium]